MQEELKSRNTKANADEQAEMKEEQQCSAWIGLQKKFEPLYLPFLSFFLHAPFFFLSLNKPLLLTPRKRKTKQNKNQTFNISDICETENSARPSRNTVGMLKRSQWTNGFVQTSVNVINLHKNENTKINDCDTIKQIQ